MKKTLTIAAALLIFSALSANAQSYVLPGESLLNDRNFMEIPATILAIYIIGKFLLSLIRMFLDQRIKTKLIDRGLPENMVSQFLPAVQTSRSSLNRIAAIKWFSILTGIGIGLLLIGLFQPWSIISLAIMCFSVAFGFLVYYFFSRKLEEPENTIAKLNVEL